MHEAAWGVLLSGLLFTGVRLAVPLLLVALGETLAEKAGVINVGMEGMMLAGALAGFAAAFSTHSPWAGAGAAVLAGVALAALFAALCVGLGADQVVVGTAVNILALGLTGVFFRARPQLNGATAASFAPLSLPFRHPALVSALFEQNAMGWLAWVLVPLIWLLLFRTRWGLRLRATGERPSAADGAGVRVARARVGAALLGRRAGGPGGGVPEPRLHGRLRGEHDGGARVHRAGRGDFGPLEPLRGGRRRPAVRAGLGLAVPGVQHAVPLPVLPRPPLPPDPARPFGPLPDGGRRARRLGGGVPAGVNTVARIVLDTTNQPRHNLFETPNSALPSPLCFAVLLLNRRRF